MTERVAIMVERYRDTDGNPTCCAKWATHQCQFLQVRKSGLIEVCGISGLDLKWGAPGWLRPEDGCPVWPVELPGSPA